MPCYSLYLTNQPVVSHPTNPIKIVYYNTGTGTAAKNTNSRLSSTWNIDFDQLFRGENYKYRKCRVRVKTSGALVANVYLFNTEIQHLSCSLSSQYNAPVTYDKCLLGMVHATDTPVSNSIFDIKCSTMESSQGVNIDIPKGQQYFTMSFASASQNGYNQLTIIGDNFLIDFILNFELYDRIDED